MHEGHAKLLYEQSGLLGLFHFMTKSWFTAMRRWCNQNLAWKGKKKLSQVQFMAYVGLEIAMSFVKLSHVKDNWNNKMFFQQDDFPNVLYGNLFQGIRGSLSLHNPDMHNHTLVSSDPFHFIVPYLEELSQSCRSYWYQYPRQEFSTAKG
jgi:hypothetical protein